jgi:site-specific DNA recombinase
MRTPERKVFRCAIYTRKSTEHNLDLEFNSLDAQREACEAYIKSQAHEGWRLIPDHYDDGGLSGASLDRPALQGLLADVRAGRINIVVVYKVDRLTRSLADFAKLVELFDQHKLSAPWRSGRSRDWLKVKNPDSPAMIRAREAEW